MQSHCVRPAMVPLLPPPVGQLPGALSPIVAPHRDNGQHFEAILGVLDRFMGADQKRRLYRKKQAPTGAQRQGRCLRHSPC
jgi:hypothetical protein